MQHRPQWKTVGRNLGVESTWHFLFSGKKDDRSGPLLICWQLWAVTRAISSKRSMLCLVFGTGLHDGTFHTESRLENLIFLSSTSTPFSISVRSNFSFYFSSSEAPSDAHDRLTQPQGFHSRSALFRFSGRSSLAHFFFGYLMHSNYHTQIQNRWTWSKSNKVKPSCTH